MEQRDNQPPQSDTAKDTNPDTQNVIDEEDPSLLR